MVYRVFKSVLACRWSTRVLKSQGRLSIDSGGYKNMKIAAGLGGSKLEARGGIIGGSVELQELNTQGKREKRTKSWKFV